MAISRSQLLKELLPGLNALFGLEYARYGQEHTEIYETESSERSFEEELILLDPVPRSHAGFLNVLDYQIPTNVKHTTCIYRRAIIPPYSCYVRYSETPYDNVRIPLTGHGLGISTHPDRADLVAEKIIAVK